MQVSPNCAMQCMLYESEEHGASYISKSCKNENYVKKMMVNEEIRNQIFNNLKQKRKLMNKKLTKRIGKWKEDGKEWEKNKIEWRNFLVKKCV